MFEGLDKVCRVIEKSGKVNGRKRLQKSIHIMKTIGFRFGESFSWGNFGAFSQDLANEVQSLTAFQFIKESFTKSNNSYQYTLTKEGMDFVIESKKKEEPLFDEMILLLNEKDVGDLELLSTCLFVWKSDESIEKLTDLVHYLKPKYRAEKVKAYTIITRRIMEAKTIEERIKIIQKEL